MEEAVVFPDACSARAAFALGAVKYRCLVCNRVHTSGSGEAERCRLNLSVQPGWGHARPAGPYPPTLHFTPAFLFAAAVWDAWWPGPPLDNFGVPEWVLALDAFAPNLEAAFEEAVHGDRERQKRCRVMAWENHRVFCGWMGALRRCRPPARIARLELITPYQKRSGYYVPPAVLPPGWGESCMKVSAERLWYNIWTWIPGNSLLRWRASTPLVLASYSKYEFAAVFEVPVGWSGGYLVCCERYGEAPVARLVHDASTPEDALNRLGERQGIPAERSPV